MSIPLPAHDAAPWLAPAVWLVARGTLLLAAAALAAALMRRRSAAARHLAWGLVMVSLLALPALSLVLPHWELAFVSVDAIHPALLVPGARAAVLAALPWGTIALALWAAGALIALVRLAVAQAAVRALAGRAEPITGGEWMERMKSAARELGVARRVRLLRASGGAMPMTWGIVHPAVLLPAEADAWSAERRRVVLLHELAHVARRDCLWQLVASLACALYWFHPGAWWAAHRMREEREQACDDRVLAAGTRASDYAGHLLAVARAFRPARLTAAAAVGMAARSQLEDRVVAVLDGARARDSVSARVALACAAIGALALLPLAAAAPSVRVDDDAPRPTPAVTASIDGHARPQPRRSTNRRVGRPEPSPVQLSSAAPVKPANALLRDAAPGPSVGPELQVTYDVNLADLWAAARDGDPDARRGATWGVGQAEPRLAQSAVARSAREYDFRFNGALGLDEYRPRPSEPARAPTGTGRAIQPPRTARKAPEARPIERPVRILSDAHEPDTLPAVGGPHAPETPQN
ncbi:M56 family metallopeptidase [Longimicrobium sp.]|jgi:beta-lactamase regulating signal transducer with metallopeptidase domain|uniref:M56 family metallopeptidase n=1 Tax=Longimicrobium sp. TaxID=2029185 RepID=UPI002F93E45A